MEGLRARADAGDWVAAARLTELLVRARGPERAANPGRRWRRACRYGQLARLLAERGDMDRQCKYSAPRRAPVTGRPPQELVGLLTSMETSTRPHK